MNNKINIVCEYFKIGDIVRDSIDSIWGKRLFEIQSFHGNSYLPLASVYFVGKDKTPNNMCNFDVRELKLISSSLRPLKKINRSSLLKIKNKSLEAKREFMIRLNTKTL